MTENYLVLDDVYYWYLEETQYESSARIRLHDLLMKEYRNVVLLKVRNLRRGYLSFDYVIYEKAQDGLGPDEQTEKERPKNERHNQANIPMH